MDSQRTLQHSCISEHDTHCVSSTDITMEDLTHTSKLQSVNAQDLKERAARTQSHDIPAEHDTHCVSSTDITMEDLTHTSKLQSVNAQDLEDHSARTQSHDIPGTIRIFQHRIGGKVYNIHEVLF